MNSQNNSQKTVITEGTSLYKQQLKEAFALISILQRSNADLMKQNAGLIQMNSRLMYKFDNSMQENHDDIFVNHVLSIITEKTRLPDDNTYSSEDKTRLVIDNPPSITDKTKLNADNTIADNDNHISQRDNNRSAIDKTANINAKNKSPNENTQKPENNTQSAIDNTKEVIDKGIVYFEINGQRNNKEKLLNILRYRINLLMQRNFSDEELISIYTDNLKKGKEKDIEQKKLLHEDKLKKVPALFQLENDNIPCKVNIGNEFSDLVTRYKLLKKRGKQKYGSLSKQVKMLLLLYKHERIKPDALFAQTGVSSVTGNRIVAKFKMFGFLDSKGKHNCYYNITETAINYLEK